MEVNFPQRRYPIHAECWRVNVRLRGLSEGPLLAPKPPQGEARSDVAARYATDRPQLGSAGYPPERR